MGNMTRVSFNPISGHQVFVWEVRGTEFIALGWYLTYDSVAAELKVCDAFEPFFVLPKNWDFVL